VLNYLMKRLIGSVGTLLGLSVIVYVALSTIPGSVIGSILGAEGSNSPEVVEQLRIEFGLDRPWHEQFLGWLSRVLVGDIGTSWVSGESVAAMIGQRLALTAQVAVMALLVSVSLALGLGVLAAAWQNRWPDHLVRGLALVGATVPVYVTATLVLLLSSSFFGWIPPSGYVSFFDDPLENLKLVATPALILGTTSASNLTRIVRGSVAEVLEQDFIRTGRAKGLSSRRILFLHALRNAAIPIVTVIGVEAGVLLSGAVVTETILALPGVGRLTVDAILQRDYPVVQGAILVIGAMFIFVNLVVDLMYGFLDPRTASSSRKSVA